MTNCDLIKTACVLTIAFCVCFSQASFVYPEDEIFKNPIENYPGLLMPNFHQQDDIITQGVLNLTLAIDKALHLEKKMDDVLVYAPVGIASALALVLLGSSGKTFQEISTVMGLNNGLDIDASSQKVHENIGYLLEKLQTNKDVEYGIKLKIATAVFLQTGYPIRPIYEETCKGVYKSEIVNMDFTNPYSQARENINKWVREKTNGKIQEILSGDPPNYTKVIIASALHFLGKWERPFFDGLTKKRPFYPNGRKNNLNAVNADMMSNGGMFPYFKDTTLNCEILGFPYKGNRTTMYIVMPVDSNKDKLEQLQRILTPHEINRLVGHVKYTKAVILFPKMKLESTIDLSNALKNIGARSLFNKYEADLGVLSPGIFANNNNQNQNVNNQNSNQNNHFNSNQNTHLNNNQNAHLNNNQNNNFNSQQNTHLNNNQNNNFNSQQNTNSNSNQNTNFNNNQNSNFNNNQNSNFNSNQNTNSNSNQNSNNQNRPFTDRHGGFSAQNSNFNAPNNNFNTAFNQNKFNNEKRDDVLIFSRSNFQEDTVDTVRSYLSSSNFQNPGLYADQVLHKVYMDITEEGTEAAATTSVSLSRGGDAITFRVDQPFLFFIMDEESKLVLFWGSVVTPTPSYS